EGKPRHRNVWESKLHTYSPSFYEKYPNATIIRQKTTQHLLHVMNKSTCFPCSSIHAAAWQVHPYP
ncbi:hypothetical protein, partial [Acinetobacter baumannii]|uniref:hypothetical protein n=1 Tax=Acinetobacter baumannii TaxID=470 RepID=UPI001969F049